MSRDLKNLLVNDQKSFISALRGWLCAGCHFNEIVSGILWIVLQVIKSGKRKKKAWKRMITKMTFVGQNFTRKPPKLERFIRCVKEKDGGALVTQEVSSWDRVEIRV